MADVFGQSSVQGGAPAPFSHAYGNAYNKSFTATKVAQIGDIIVLGRIPAGTIINDFDLVNATGPASITGRVGYRAADGSGTPATVDNYWFPTGTGLTTNARTQSKAQPITFNADVDVILTVEAAASNASAISAVAHGEMLGVR